MYFGKKSHPQIFSGCYFSAVFWGGICARNGSEIDPNFGKRRFLFCHLEQKPERSHPSLIKFAAVHFQEHLYMW